MGSEVNVPDQWRELSPEQRASLLDLAKLNEKERNWLHRKSKNGAFWTEFGERVALMAEKAKVPMTVILTFTLVLQFFGDGIAAFAEGFLRVWRGGQ